MQAHLSDESIPEGWRSVVDSVSLLRRLAVVPRSLPASGSAVPLGLVVGARTACGEPGASIPAPPSQVQAGARPCLLSSHRWECRRHFAVAACDVMSLSRMG